MKATKEERQVNENTYGCQNNADLSICEGQYYIFNRGKMEYCKNKAVCLKHSNYRLALKNNTLYGEAEKRVRFFYVASFRECSLHSKQ